MAIRTTQIDGDISVGRNVALGGGAYVEGNSIFKSNVRVDGWLDAKNLRGADKGLYTTQAELLARYPNPEEGWWALVGLNSPFEIWRVVNGAWVNSGEYQGGTVDLSGLQDEVDDWMRTTDGLSGTVSDQGEEIDTIKKTVDDLEGEVRNQADTVNEQLDNINSGLTGLTGRVGDTEESVKGLNSATESLAGKVTDLEESVANHSLTLSGFGALKERVDLLYASKGRPGGIAPLDKSGLVPAAHLPANTGTGSTETTPGTGSTETTPARTIIPFYDVVSTERVMNSTTRPSTYDERYRVCYNRPTESFVLAMPYREGDFDITKCEVAATWADDDKYETLDPAVLYQAANGDYYEAQDGRLVKVAYKPPVSDDDQMSDYLAIEALNAKISGFESKIEPLLPLVADVSALKAWESGDVPTGLINANELLGRRGEPMEFARVLALIDEHPKREAVEFPGVILTYLTASGWQTKQWTNSTSWSLESCWEDLCMSVSSTRELIDRTVKTRFASLLAVLGQTDGLVVKPESEASGGHCAEDCDCRDEECDKSDIDEILS